MAMRDAEGTALPASFWVNALRRNIPLILVFGLLGAGLGYGFAIQRGNQYVAKAAILISPLEGNPYHPDSRGDDLGTLETEATLAVTDPVARLAGTILPGDQDRGELLDQITVEVPTNTQVLEFEAITPGRTLSRDVAQAFAEGYLQYRVERAQTVIDGQIQRVREQRAGVQSDLNEAEVELGSDELSASRRSYLEERVNNLGAQLASLEAQESTLTATDLVPGQVITEARLPDPVGWLMQAVFSAAGGFAGLILGLMVAIGRTRLDTRVHESPDLERFGVPVLGSVLHRFTQPTGAGRAPDLPETYREIRTAIVTSLDSPPVGLTVTATDADVSAAPEAAALAVGLARAGFTVALVDTIGEPTRLVSERTGLPGLSELLSEQADLQTLLIQPEERLSVLPPGAGHGQAMDRLLSPRMRHSLAQLSEWNDYVLIAGGQAHSADGQAMASLTGAVLLVVGRHRARLNDFIECLDVLDRVDAACVGAVLVSVPKGRRSARRANRAGREDWAERGSQSDYGDRAGLPDRSDQGARGARGDQGARGARGDQGDRPDRGARGGRRDSGGRGDQGGRDYGAESDRGDGGGRGGRRSRAGTRPNPGGAGPLYRPVETRDGTPEAAPRRAAGGTRAGEHAYRNDAYPGEAYPVEAYPGEAHPAEAAHGGSDVPADGQPRSGQPGRRSRAAARRSGHTDGDERP